MYNICHRWGIIGSEVTPSQTVSSFERGLQAALGHSHAVCVQTSQAGLI